MGPAFERRVSADICHRGHNPGADERDHWAKLQMAEHPVVPGVDSGVGRLGDFMAPSFSTRFGVVNSATGAERHPQKLMTGFATLQIEQSTKVGMPAQVTERIIKSAALIIELFRGDMEGIDAVVKSLRSPLGGNRSRHRLTSAATIILGPIAVSGKWIRRIGRWSGDIHDYSSAP